MDLRITLHIVLVTLAPIACGVDGKEFTKSSTCPSTPEDFVLEYHATPEHFRLTVSYWELLQAGDTRHGTPPDGVVRRVFCALRDAKRPAACVPNGRAWVTQRRVRTEVSCQFELLWERIRADLLRTPHTTARCQVPGDFQLRTYLFPDGEDQLRVSSVGEFSLRGFEDGRVAPSDVRALACGLMQIDWARLPIDERGLLAFCPEERDNESPVAERSTGMVYELTYHGDTFQVVFDRCFEAAPRQLVAQFQQELRQVASPVDTQSSNLLEPRPHLRQQPDAAPFYEAREQE